MSASPNRIRNVAVVGGGISGLTAALDLQERYGDAVRITVIEGGQQLGGKLLTGETGGRVTETGAETFLAREADDPSGAPSAAITLAHRVGLGGALRYPSTLTAAILAGGNLGPVPAGTLMGIPGDLSALNPWWMADVPPQPDQDLGRPVLGPREDVTVGSLVRSRMGGAIVERLVDPLLGGVYAGRADDLSIAVTMPGLAAACRETNTLQDAVRLTLSRRPAMSGPSFAAIEGGLTRLVYAVADSIKGLQVEIGRPVREIAQSPTGWRVTYGSAHAPATLDADAVVLALPAHPAGRLLEPLAPRVASAIGALDYASIALVALALPPNALAGTGLEGRSGALIPAAEGYSVKAITVFSTKWAPQPDRAVLLRASLGRYGEEAVLQATDSALTSLVQDELSSIVSAQLPQPYASRVTRWGGGLPQYRPGHSDRIAAARAELPATLALAGAAFDGIGIPACIKSGQRAAKQVMYAWGDGVLPPDPRPNRR